MSTSVTPFAHTPYPPLPKLLPVRVSAGGVVSQAEVEAGVLHPGPLHHELALNHPQAPAAAQGNASAAFVLPEPPGRERKREVRRG